MAFRYRKVDPRIWHDETFIGLPVVEKLITLYIITAQSNRIGLFVYSPGKAMEELGLPARIFWPAFRHVLTAFAWSWDEKTRVLYIDTWWKYNPPENANNVVGNLKDLEDLPANPFLSAFASNLTCLDGNLHETFTHTLAKRHPERSTQRYPKGSPEPSTKRSPSQDQDQEQDQEQEGSGEESARERAGARPQLTPEALKEKWNTIPGIKPCKAIGPTIRTTIRARLKEHPEGDWWDELFQQIGASDFLCGRKNGRDGPFIASLDWVLKPKNLDKIRAGNYDGGGTTGSQTCQKRIQQPGDQFLRPCGKPQSGYSSNSKPLCAEHLKEHEHDRHAQSPSA